MMQITDTYRWYLVPDTMNVVLCNKAHLYLLHHYYKRSDFVEVCRWYVERLEGRPQVGIAVGRVKEQFQHHIRVKV